jgi:hypothetical protein
MNGIHEFVREWQGRSLAIHSRAKGTGARGKRPWLKQAV